MAKRKLNGLVKHYDELGPLSLLDELRRDRLSDLAALRFRILAHTGCVEALKDIDDEVDALKRSSAAVMRWMEKAIQEVPWSRKNYDSPNQQTNPQ